jgi:hypothetical protein
MSAGRPGIGLPALVALLALPVSVASPAWSQDSSALKKEMVGQWELSTTERSKTCVVTLKGDASPQGLKLELEPGCAAALPFTKDIAAWNVKGLDIVRLQDAAGQPVIDFTEVEADFRGLRQGEGITSCKILPRALAKSMDQMIGDWSMVRGNGVAICSLTLTNTEASPDNFQVFSNRNAICDRGLRAHAMAARSRPDDIDVGQRRHLAVRGRRQCAMAAGARQRRPADHAAAVISAVECRAFQVRGI